jgi:ubiquinone/menaquinone biosynthesis C-methylase UbiE
MKRPPERVHRDPAASGVANVDVGNVREFFDTDAYLTRNPIVLIRARLVAELLADLHGARVLDLGCGDGSVSLPLRVAGNDVTLVDFSEKMLRRATRAATSTAWGKAEYVQADVLDWEPEGVYEAVLCIGLLAHVSSPDRLLKRAATATRPGGHCILQITDGGHPLGWLLSRYARIRQREGYRLNELTRQKLVALAARYGLMPLESRRYGLLLPGTGRLPYLWQLRLEDWVASSWLSHATAELLVVFEREN